MRRDADILAKTTGGIHAQIIAGNDYLIPVGKGTIAALHHLSGSIDAGGMRILLRNPRPAHGREGILEVERRVVHLYQQISCRQISNLPGAYAPGKVLGRRLFNNHGGKARGHHRCFLRRQAARSPKNIPAAVKIQIVAVTTISLVVVMGTPFQVVVLFDEIIVAQHTLATLDTDQ